LEEPEHLKVLLWKSISSPPLEGFGRAGALEESQITVPPDLKTALASIVHQNSSSS